LTGVKVRDDESFERALRRFNKFCEKAGILTDIKKHQHFEKPSEARKRKLAPQAQTGGRPTEIQAEQIQR
jgi:small subunit ribosomal protein S21